ncbi:MAG: DNA topoisomerase VI subunit B [Candidatus Thorarchaeota archaeon]
MMIESPSVDTFRGISPAEFFYRNRQMAGFSNPTQALFTTVRELVENSLDSCEDAGVLPRILITIDRKTPNVVLVSVSDNGTGVPTDVVPEAFGQVLYGSKYNSRQRRGTFGLGVTMSVLYGQITADSPVIIHTRTSDSEGMEYSILVDVEKNAPIIHWIKKKPRSEVGTTVTVELQGDLPRARERIIEYIRLSGISSPYALFELDIIGHDQLRFGGFTKTLPQLPTVSKPHPHAADMELLRRLIAERSDARLSEFLVDSFQQIGVQTARKFLKFINQDPQVIVGTLSRADVSRISHSLRKYSEFGRPRADSLSPIGEEQFLRSIKAEFESTVMSYGTRGPLDWDGFPYIIEGALALGDKFQSNDLPLLIRFANRVPLLYDTTDDVFTKVLKKIPWNKYGLKERNNVALFVHFCSTRVPYSAAGKQSIASVSTIDSEILSLYRELGRRLNKISEKHIAAGRYQRKYREFSRAFKLIVKFSGEVAGAAKLPDADQMIRKLFEVDDDVKNQ